MPDTAAATPVDRARYVAAFIGAHIAFLPLLTFLLPLKVTAMTDRPILALSILLIIGAAVASVANIGVGRISDVLMKRHGNRRRVAGLGLGLTCLALAVFALAASMVQLVAALILFQVALNLLFAPLVAALADHVPDSQKGLTAGLLNIALPAATLATGATALAWPWAGNAIFVMLALVVAALVLPFVAAWPVNTIDRPVEGDLAPLDRRDFALAWVARLGVQFGAAVVLSYLYIYVGQLAGSASLAQQRLGELTLWATPFALAAGVWAGRFTDRSVRRRPMLIASSLACGAALALLVLASNWAAITIGFILFLAALTTFLAVDSAMVAQLLLGHDRRGWALGWMNLTNTIPAIAAPSVAIAFALAGPAPMVIRLSLAVSAGLALASALAVRAIRSVR